MQDRILHLHHLIISLLLLLHFIFQRRLLLFSDHRYHPLITVTSFFLLHVHLHFLQVFESSHSYLCCFVASYSSSSPPLSISFFVVFLYSLSAYLARIPSTSHRFFPLLRLPLLPRSFLLIVLIVVLVSLLRLLYSTMFYYFRISSYCPSSLEMLDLLVL